MEREIEGGLVVGHTPNNEEIAMLAACAGVDWRMCPGPGVTWTGGD